jgi:microcystin-dependent protein
MVYAKTTWVASTSPGISYPRLNNLESQYAAAIKIGEVIMYGGDTAPTDFFLCNGTSKSNITYPTLFAVTSFKFGGSSTWFNLPNLQGVFIAGYTTGAAAYDQPGDSGGSSSVTLASSNLPEHTHDIYLFEGGGTNTGIIMNNVPVADSAGETLAQGGGGGSTTPHNNIPPYIVVNYCIRYQ